ncbi:MAG: APC family permease [Sandaracinaceae bacterium]|nr:APC family permease [Sandaracinaceae bacterium]
MGIFVSPPVVAQLLNEPWAFFAVWLLGGLFALAGASAYAELGARYPRAGGDYVFVREALGPSAGFATGFMLFSCVFAGSIATLASILATDQLPGLLGFLGVTVPARFTLFAGTSIDSGRVLGLVFIVLLTAVNLRGAKAATVLQVWTTAIPLVAMIAMAGFAITSGAAAEPISGPARHAPITAAAVGHALVVIYFAYSGWNAIAYVGGEIAHPERTLPLGLLGGTALVTALYMVVCAAYASVLGMDGLAAASDAGIATAALFDVQAIRVVIASLIAITLLGSLNGSVLAGGRIAVAMRLPVWATAPSARWCCKARSPASCCSRARSSCCSSSPASPCCSSVPWPWSRCSCCVAGTARPPATARSATPRCQPPISCWPCSWWSCPSRAPSRPCAPKTTRGRPRFRCWASACSRCRSARTAWCSAGAASPSACQPTGSEWKESSPASEIETRFRPRPFDE